MEYRDVHNIVPGSYMWRFPAPGSEKVSEEYTPQWFIQDYKTSYRNSTHYLRRIRPKVQPPRIKLYNFPVEEETKNELYSLIEDSKSNFNLNLVIEYF